MSLFNKLKAGLTGKTVAEVEAAEPAKIKPKDKERTGGRKTQVINEATLANF